MLESHLNTDCTAQCLMDPELFYRRMKPKILKRYLISTSFPIMPPLSLLLPLLNHPRGDVFGIVLWTEGNKRHTFNAISVPRTLSAPDQGWFVQMCNNTLNAALTMPVKYTQCGW